MMLHPTYFPNIFQFMLMVESSPLVFEVCDNYQKQTYRNRCVIYGANGKLTLTIPVSYSQKQRQNYKDVKIFNADNWQLQHLKSLESAYRMSPFFEYYIDDLKPLFKSEFKLLIDFNLACFDKICECLEFKCSYTLTENYVTNAEHHLDYRHLVNTKQQLNINLTPYTQVFTQKHGFIDNLSILDLLFNEGPNTLMYLKSQHIHY